MIKIEIKQQEPDKITQAVMEEFLNKKIGAQTSYHAEVLLARLRNLMVENRIIIEDAEEYMPIDMWEETKHPELSEDIKCHIDNYIENEEDKYQLKRMIFISIRERLDQ